MPWQKWFLLHALELHPTEVDDYGDPTFRFRKVVLLVGRQNGKSTVMQALTLWRMYVDRCSLVIGTAQDLEVAESLWGESVEMAQETEELNDEIGKIERQPGRKMFRLRSGETYKVKAATRRGGRGLSGELVLLDELREHQTWDAWAAVTKTTNAKSRAQVYGISNAGDGSSVVLRHLRKTAHAELGDPDGINSDASELVDDLDGIDPDEIDDSGLGIFEWSAPSGADIFDRDAWAQANPALGWRIREATLASDARTDPEWVFRTECLCQWSDGSLQGPFPPGVWEALQDDASAAAAESPLLWGLDVSVTSPTAHIGVAGLREDGIRHIEVVASRAGVHWVGEWFRERVVRYGGMRVAIQARGCPASALIEDLEAIEETDAETGKVHKVEVVAWGGSDLVTGTIGFYNAVVLPRPNPDGSPVVDDEGHRVDHTRGLRHRDQPGLNLAAATAEIKPMADGGWVWDRKKSATDIAP